MKFGNRFMHRALFGALAGVGLFAICALPGRADAGDVTVSPDHAIGAIRGGIFLPTDNATSKNLGKYVGSAGLDISFAQSPYSYRSNISVDYMEESLHGNNLRMIPVTVNQIWYGGSGVSRIRPYFGLGMGAYFIHVRDSEDPSIASNGDNKTDYGGFAAIGSDLGSNLFVDLRYHVVGSVEDLNADGFQASLGVRF
jgi:hypothetical protein